MNHWSIEQAKEQYAIPIWGEGYFDISEAGDLCVFPEGPDGPGVALDALIKQVGLSGARLPVLLRFPQILEHRAYRLQSAFSEAMESCDYQGDYTAAYPIKVNQQHTVVDTLASIQGAGLEAGSKPELIAVLAHSKPGGLVICNGYKDREYIRLALMGLKLGLKVYLVVEKPNELAVILEEAKALDVKPLLGVRLRLTSLGSGNWQNSGGERAKFGLSANQLMNMIAELESAHALDCLSLLHFHMGSQLSSIRDIHRGVREAGRYLLELHRLGVKIQVMDIGGGLAVDYEGTRSRDFCSMNYSVDQYASGVVQTLVDICDQYDLPHPHIVSESGRAMTAHHAVLVSNVSAVESMDSSFPDVQSDEPDVLQNLRRIYQEMDEHPLQEAWLEAGYYLEEGRNLFLYGDLSLGHRALLDRLYFAVLVALRGRLNPDRRRHRDLLEQVNEKLADKYFLNLSVFQSMPDIWAIDQIFPIAPLNRLDEYPSRRGVIEDLTCDSDGRIDRFVDREGIEPSLALHPLKQGEDYLLGLFMVGAYQETLGDIHNLFGDTDSVDVRIGDEIELSNIRQGDHAVRLLEMVGYRRDDLEQLIQEKVERAGLDREDSKALDKALKQGLDSYTYLQNG